MSLSNQSPKQQHLFKDQRTAKKNRPSLIRQLEISDGALILQNPQSKLNLPQIGSMKQIKLAKDISATIGSGSPNGSLQARKLRRAEGAPRNKGSVEVSGMGIIGSSVKGKNQSMDMYGIGELGEDRDSEYSSDDIGENNNISRLADASMI